jgi:hypothetical protein
LIVIFWSILTALHRTKSRIFWALIRQPFVSGMIAREIWTAHIGSGKFLNTGFAHYKQHKKGVV